MQVQFKQWKCELQLGQYRNGQPLIELYDDDGPVGTASTALEAPLPKGFVYIKDYSENEGMLECLVKAGVVSQPVRYQPSGFVLIPVCKLLV